MQEPFPLFYPEQCILKDASTGELHLTARGRELQAFLEYWNISGCELSSISGLEMACARAYYRAAVDADERWYLENRKKHLLLTRQREIEDDFFAAMFSGLTSEEKDRKLADTLLAMARIQNNTLPSRPLGDEETRFYQWVRGVLDAYAIEAARLEMERGELTAEEFAYFEAHKYYPESVILRS